MQQVEKLIADLRDPVQFPEQPHTCINEKDREAE